MRTLYLTNAAEGERPNAIDDRRLLGALVKQPQLITLAEDPNLNKWGSGVFRNSHLNASCASMSVTISAGQLVIGSRTLNNSNGSLFCEIEEETFAVSAPLGGVGSHLWRNDLIIARVYSNDEGGFTSGSADECVLEYIEGSAYSNTNTVSLPSTDNYVVLYRIKVFGDTTSLTLATNVVDYRNILSVTSGTTYVNISPTEAGTGGDEVIITPGLSYHVINGDEILVNGDDQQQVIYTPAVTNAITVATNLVPGSITAGSSKVTITSQRFKKEGELVFVDVLLSLSGAVTFSNSNSLTLTLPPDYHGKTTMVGMYVGNGTVYDEALTKTCELSAILTASNTVSIRVNTSLATSTSYGRYVSFGTSRPWTLSSGDKITFSLVFPAA